MTSRNIINIILFLFVAILISILLYDFEATPNSTFSLSSLKEQDIKNIEITRVTGETLKFIKKNNQWTMTTPYKVRANSFYIESLLQITQARSKSQFTISDADKNKFRLNPPQATLKLNTQLFLFGTNEQLNLNRYILSENKLFLIPDRYFYLLNSTTPGFIDHALIGQHARITRLKLLNNDIQLIKSKWVVKPDNTKTEVDDIVQLITEWNNSQAIEITLLKDQSYIQNNNFEKITIELTSNSISSSINFDIIKNDDFYLFVRRDLKLQFKLNHDMASRLLELPASEK